MESLRLDGTTIRGVVRGRPVHCVVRSFPDGLVLPQGQYLLRVGEDNPIYGLFLSVEAAAGPGAAPAHNIFKTPPSAMKDSPSFNWDKMPPTAIKHSPAAIATLVPADPTAHKIAPPAHKIAPEAAHKIAPAAHKVAATAHKIAPAGKVDAPAIKFDAPAGKVDAPAIKFDTPSIKFDTPSIKFDAPAIKLDFVPGQGMTARVIIAVRPIGPNSLVAQAGFSDLVDAVRQADGVTLIVP